MHRLKNTRSRYAAKATKMALMVTSMSPGVYDGIEVL